MQELHKLYQDLSVLVVGNGEKIDIVADNVERAVDRVEEGTKQLEKVSCIADGSLISFPKLVNSFAHINRPQKNSVRFENGFVISLLFFCVSFLHLFFPNEQTQQFNFFSSLKNIFFWGGD